nr:helix-turn-helix transcriptional regulator [Paenibacillus cisolokensis]
MEVLDRICTYFQVQPNEIIEHKADKGDNGQ